LGNPRWVSAWGVHKLQRYRQTVRQTDGWQRGLVVVKLVSRHSVARPRKPPVRRKHLRDVSYISRVIANFVPNFVALATGVIRGEI